MEEEMNEFLYEVEEDAHYDEYEQEQMDYLTASHNPLYEYEGSTGEDDDMSDLHMFNFHVEESY
jgi:hypothetical protein